MASPARRRLIVTVSDAPQVDLGQVVRELRLRGFEVGDVLGDLGCVLGEFAGDQDVLRKIEGIVAVEEEDTMEAK